MSYVPELWARGRERFRLPDFWQQEIDSQSPVPDFALPPKTEAFLGQIRWNEDRYAHYTVPEPVSDPVSAHYMDMINKQNERYVHTFAAPWRKDCACETCRAAYPPLTSQQFYTDHPGRAGSQWDAPFPAEPKEPTPIYDQLCEQWYPMRMVTVDAG